ncbi:prolyl oligopeptidase family serine peptidase [Streptomyces sp. N2-109]|uniref:Prolyl oligopeptidase family serine peptidase n=1 Tax=Streptomyces gossypii TaxID=2883101 RepID=A0ABT2JTK2_9ACTN|nr:prolyl oligopeptidase family serine peptidase [Streptomyces gossypii]MCT2590809.1 prolyl oligopeptidase family serine peptidase [Streptomyces gossypii]
MTTGGTGTREPEPGGAETERGYRVYRAVIPEVCPTDPTRMVLTADAGGRCEVFAHDAATGRDRQVTDRPHGTLHGTLDRDGVVWWFDEDLAGHGVWRIQDFGGGPDSPGLPPAPAGTPRGLAMNAAGQVAAGIGGPDGLTVWLGRRGGPARIVHRAPGPRRLTGLSPDGELLTVAGPPSADRAVTVLTRDGGTVAEFGGGGLRIWALGFAPAASPSELLLVTEHGARYRLATWDVRHGLREHDWCAFDTEIDASWYPDTHRVLIRQDRHGRSLLHTADLDRRTLSAVTTPPGSIPDAAPRTGGEIHYLWTDSATPPRLRTTAPAGTARTGPPVLGTLPGRVPGVHSDLWTPGPDGPVHTLLSLPERTGARPAPLVFLLHGGPADHDRDAYDGIVHSLVASGLGVARVNYRGSTGYGPRWRAAFSRGVGLTQVDDLVAVRADLLRRGLAREDGVGLWGTSWGGALALLALGVRPALWQAGIAVKPIADFAAAHRTGLPALRALDERLFGGTPDAVPERYARSSPVTYAARVTAPVLVVAASQDAKCPPQQIADYLTALRKAGVPHESVWLESGHDGYRGADHVATLRRALEFLHRHLGARARPAAPEAPRSERSGARQAGDPEVSGTGRQSTEGRR